MNSLFLALLIYTFALRLFELRLSRDHELQLRALNFIRRDSQASYACMVAVHALWLLGLVLEPLLFPRSENPALIFASLIIFCSAQFLRYWTISSLGVFWNVHVMTPAASAAPPKNWPVTHGPYRLLRHPNYVVVILEFVSLPLVGGAYFTAAAGCLANLAVLAARISDEDRSLESLPRYLESFHAAPPRGGNLSS